MRVCVRERGREREGEDVFLLWSPAQSEYLMGYIHIGYRG